MNEPVKLIISYDMKAGKEEDCHRYIVQEMGATLNEFGFRFTDAWYTAWGNGPQIMGCGLLDDLEIAEELLKSDVWHDVVDGLLPYVENFSIRLVQPTGSFQI